MNVNNIVNREIKRQSRNYTYSAMTFEEFLVSVKGYTYDDVNDILCFMERWQPIDIYRLEKEFEEHCYRQNLTPQYK